MNFFKEKSLPRDAATNNFDMLRAGLEVEIQRPAVVAITSSTTLDGSEVASRGLAQSLASTGYPTLFIDTTPTKTSRTRSHGTIGRTLEEIGRHVEPSANVGNYVTLILGDPTLQKTTSQRELQSALELFKTKFDYIVVAVEDGVSTSFSTSIVAAADAVLVTIRTGRRENSADSDLAESLDRLGARFLGVVALEAAVINADATARSSATAKEAHRVGAVSLDQDFARREVAEWPT